jgi:colanic acid biosynthesis protein WcaH
MANFVCIDKFREIVELTPLIAIDLLIIFNKKLLVCKRLNNPAKGYYFVPGGRILKNETINEAKKRVLRNEINLTSNDYSDSIFVGLYEHFYANTFFSSNTSTHYITIAYKIELSSEPEIILDNQHSHFIWVDISQIDQNDIHQYTKNYILASHEKN